MAAYLVLFQSYDRLLFQFWMKSS